MRNRIVVVGHLGRGFGVACRLAVLLLGEVFAFIDLRPIIAPIIIIFARVTSILLELLLGKRIRIKFLALEFDAISLFVKTFL